MEEKYEIDFLKLKEYYENSGCWEKLGLKLVRANHDRATVELLVKEEFLNSLTYCHGGIMTIVADAAMGVAMVLEGRRGVTLEINQNLIRHVHPGDILSAEGEVLHKGSRSIVCEVKMYIKQSGKLCGVGRGTFLSIAGSLQL